MVECYLTSGGTLGSVQSFGYKRNNEKKVYAGTFDLHERFDRFEIWSLKIFPRYRNKGNGTRMLTEFLSQFNSDKPLFLYVYKTNEIAIRLYEKVGFVITGDCYFDSTAYTMQYYRKD